MAKKDKNVELDRIVDREFKDFVKMCPKDQNPVLSVLRVHLLTEYYMERIFHLKLPRGDQITESTLSYAQKIALLEALALMEEPRTVQCLKNLNRVRNRCAHEYDKIITVADIEFIGRPLGHEHTEIRRSYVDSTNEYLWHILSLVCRNMVAQIYSIEQSILGKKDIDTKED